MFFSNIWLDVLQEVKQKMTAAKFSLTLVLATYFFRFFSTLNEKNISLQPFHAENCWG